MLVTMRVGLTDAQWLCKVVYGMLCNVATKSITTLPAYLASAENACMHINPETQTVVSSSDRIAATVMPEQRSM